MEDLLMSAARTIIEQSRRIENLEATCNKLSRRIDDLEIDHESTKCHTYTVEANLCLEKDRYNRFINDLYDAINRHQSSCGY